MRAADIFGALFGWTGDLHSLLPWVPAWMGVVLLLLGILIECLIIGAGFILVVMGIRRLMQKLIGEHKTELTVTTISGILVGLILTYLAGYYLLAFLLYLVSGGDGGCPPGEYCGPTRYE